MRSYQAGAVAVALAAAAVSASLPPARAQTVPPAMGSDLLRSCNALLAYATKGGELGADVASCAAYLKGLRDGVEGNAQRAATRAFCADAAGLDDLARAVVKHLEASPDTQRRPAAAEAIAALTRAYPCAK